MNGTTEFHDNSDRITIILVNASDLGFSGCISLLTEITVLGVLPEEMEFLKCKHEAGLKKTIDLKKKFRCISWNIAVLMPDEV